MARKLILPAVAHTRLAEILPFARREKRYIPDTIKNQAAKQYSATGKLANNAPVNATTVAGGYRYYISTANSDFSKE